MTTLEPNEVLTFLHRSQLLTAPQLEVVERERYTTESAEQLVEGLVQRGWLTPFQKKYVLSGQGDKLIVGPFRLTQPLGEGGMGVVYLAWQPRLDRNIALKVIRPQILAVRPEVVLRFHREARAIAKLMHPNIVILYDADEADGMHYIAMEYVDGLSLEKMVRLNGPLMIRQACDYIRQCGLGLQHSHEMGLVHRDIKPSNLLVARRHNPVMRTSPTGNRRPALVTQRDREMSIDSRETNRPGSWGTMKILDMGLARLADSLEEESHGETPLTRAGVLLGTPDFIAPEQARDARKADGRADIYSLGCTFYYLLTGRPPFPGGTDVQKLLRHQSERPTPVEELRPHIPTAVVTILQKMMEKKLETRYQNGQELANALEDYLKSTAVPTGEVPNSPYPGPVAAGTTPQAIFETQQDLPPVPSSEPIATAMVTMYTAGHEIGKTGYIQAHKSVVSSVAFSRDGSRVASVGIDGRVRVWDFSANPVAEVAGLPRPGTELIAVCFAPHDDFLVVGGTQKKDCRVWRWDWKESRVFDWGHFQDERRGMGAMAFSPDGKSFAAGIGGRIALWKLAGRDSKSRSMLKGHESSVRALAFSPDGKMIASGGEDKLLKLWTFGWFGPTERSSCEGHTDTITSLMFHPTDNRIISGSQDQSVVLWDSTNPSFDSAVSMTENKGTIRIAKLLPDNRHLLAIADTGLVTLWDVATCSRISDCQLDISMVSCLTLASDGHRVVVGTTDGRLRMFSLEAILPKGA